MQNDRYPKLHIRSKRELALHISDRKFPVDKSLELINDVLNNFDNYWRDSKKHSQPEAEKWVRDASYSKLGMLLRRINEKVLVPHDNLIPGFIFGGLSGRDHKKAVLHLLGLRRGRILLKLDIKRFYENNTEESVRRFFDSKTGGRSAATKILTQLTCIPVGKKGGEGDYKSIARGFSTSSRLAVWCNLDTFMRIDWLVKRELKGKDPRLAIYVDDIGITASRVTKEDMMRLYEKIKVILENNNTQKLPLNEKKSKIIYHSGEMFDMTGKSEGKGGFEHLGIQMNRNGILPAIKTRRKYAAIKSAVRNGNPKNRALRIKKKMIQMYAAYIQAPPK